ncbi:MAG: ABC transporter permease [bacterium]|nr:ABC transporter permease [bacterium]MDE0289717.1 ABC transporter permease [bacterium]MDE0440172.1 ABC transporter permease [bacterium]
MRFTRRLRTPWWLPVTVPIGSVMAAFLVGAAVLLVTGHNPVDTYIRLFERGFLSENALSSTLRSATPLVFTGLAAAAAFRMRLWNIGGEGQLYMGAIGASGIGLALDGAASIVVIPAMILGGAVFGALWAFVPGILRSRFNTNEIITSLMLNYVAGLVLAYLVLGSMSPWRDQSPGTTFPLGARLSESASWPQFLTGLPLLVAVPISLGVVAGVAAWTRHRTRSRTLRVNVVVISAVAVAALLFAGVVADGPAITVPFGIVLGVATAIVVWVLYRETRFGFEVRVISDSPAAAHYGGMDTGRKIVVVMLLAGGLAGLGGASQVGDFSHLLDPYGLPQSVYGYTGIVVAALSANGPLGVILAAFLLGGLSNAGFSLRGLDFPLGLVGILQGLILFFAIGGTVLVRYRVRFRQRRATGEESPDRQEPDGSALAGARGGEQ